MLHGSIPHNVISDLDCSNKVEVTNKKKFTELQRLRTGRKELICGPFELTEPVFLVPVQPLYKLYIIGFSWLAFFKLEILTIITAIIS